MQIENSEKESAKRRKQKSAVNYDIIKSTAYKEKLQNLPVGPAILPKIYRIIEKIMKHRSGTLFEDMYILDSTSGDVVLVNKHSKVPQEITGDNNIAFLESQYREGKYKKGAIFGIHNHPSSFPPSGDDFECAYNRGYQFGLIACHDGTLYFYTIGDTKVDASYYDALIVKMRRRIYTIDGWQNMTEHERDIKAYEMALTSLKEHFEINWRVL